MIKFDIKLIFLINFLFFILMHHDSYSSYDNRNLVSNESKSEQVIFPFYNYTFSINPLDKWKIETNFNFKNGMLSVLNLEDNNLFPNTSKAFIRIDSYLKDKKNTNWKFEIIDSLLNIYDFDYFLNDSGKNIVELPPIEKKKLFNGDRKQVEAIIYKGISFNDYHALAYFEENEFVVVFILSTSTLKDLKDTYKDFKKLISSFKILPNSIKTVKIVPFNNRQQGTLEYLENAYKYDSDSLLKNFFDYFAENIFKIDSNVNRNFSIINQVNEIYRLFYNPKDKSSIVGYTNNDLYIFYAKYIVVQNKINVIILNSYQIIDTIRKKSIVDKSISYNSDKLNYRIVNNFTINNFKPKIKIENSKIIYLDDEFSRILYKFLNTEEFKDLSKGGRVSTILEENMVINKIIFLNRMYRIFHSYHGGWQIETFPFVNDIVFNSEMNEAVIFFRIYSWGGEAIFNLIDNKWVMLDSRLTWIE
jgi:hypothetical protein